MRSYLKSDQDREFQAGAAGSFFFFFWVKKSQAYENALRNSGVQCGCSPKCAMRKACCKQITESLDAILGPECYPADHREPLEH